MTERDLHQFATNLRRGDDGIWVGTTNRAELWYPDQGNESCFQVEDTSFWFRHRNRCIAAIFRLFPPPGVVFDVGGGNGFVTAGLRAAGFDAVLVEPGPDGARNGRRRGIPDVVCATVEDAEFIPGSLPAVGMFDVLEHIEDDVGFLRNVGGLLQPGGRIYIAVPAFQVLWSSEDSNGGHFRRYTLASLEKTLASAGFVMEHGSYMFQWLWFPILLLRTLPSLLHIGGKAAAAEPTAQMQRDHAGPRSSLWDALLDREYRAISSGRRVSFGSSCIVVAHT